MQRMYASVSVLGYDGSELNWLIDQGFFDP